MTRGNSDIGREYDAVFDTYGAFVDDGVLQVRVDSMFAVRDVQAAHERFRRGGLNGKVTLLF